MFIIFPPHHTLSSQIILVWFFLSLLFEGFMCLYFYTHTHKHSPHTNSVVTNFEVLVFVQLQSTGFSCRSTVVRQKEISLWYALITGDLFSLYYLLMVSSFYWRKMWGEFFDGLLSSLFCCKISVDKYTVT